MKIGDKGTNVPRKMSIVFVYNNVFQLNLDLLNEYKIYLGVKISSRK